MMHSTTTGPVLYGLVAEFVDTEQIIAATKRATDAGYQQLDAYTPFPVHGLPEALKFGDKRVPWTVFLGGLSGCILGFMMQVYVELWDYPQNVGGRPHISWPSFMPVTYESTILCAAFSAVLGMLFYNGLPRPHHPIFNAKNFERATTDRFFLCIEAADPKFDKVETKAFLESLHPQSVSEVDD